MIVPFLDLRSPYLELQEELDAAYARVMESGWYVLGEEVRSGAGSEGCRERSFQTFERR